MATHIITFQLFQGLNDDNIKFPIGKEPDHEGDDENILGAQTCQPMGSNPKPMWIDRQDVRVEFEAIVKFEYAS